MILPRFCMMDDFSPFEQLLLQHGGRVERVRKHVILHNVTAQRRISYYIRSGTAKMSLINEEGKESTVLFWGRGTIYPVHCMNDLFSLESYLYLVAVTDLEVIAFPSSSVEKIIAQSPAFSKAIVNYFCRYTNILISKSLLSSYSDTSQTVYAFLYLYLYSKPRRDFVVDLTKDEIGKIVGLSRVSLWRALGTLVEQGIIESGRGRIRVLDMERLKQLCTGIVNEENLA